MNIPYINKESVPIPDNDYSYPFIDKEDEVFKVKLPDGRILSFFESEVEFGVVTKDKKIQKLDMSGDNPVPDGEPIELPIVIITTGYNEPIYS